MVKYMHDVFSKTLSQYKYIKEINYFELKKKIKAYLKMEKTCKARNTVSSHHMLCSTANHFSIVTGLISRLIIYKHDLEQFHCLDLSEGEICKL